MKKHRPVIDSVTGITKTLTRRQPSEPKTRIQPATSDNDASAPKVAEDRDLGTIKEDAGWGTIDNKGGSLSGSSSSEEDHHVKFASRTEVISSRPEKDGTSPMSAEDLVDHLGISGICAVFSEDQDMLPLISFAVQAWFLQATFLYYLAIQINPDKPSGVPGAMTFAAVYLHVISSIHPISYSVLFMVFSGRGVKLRREQSWVVGSVLFIDSVIVTNLQLILGALYLCESTSVEELLLNSCAVSFISEIDNMILSLQNSFSKVAPTKSKCGVFGSILENNEDIHLPSMPGIFSFLNRLTSFIPLVPVCVTLSLMRLGAFIDGALTVKTSAV